MTVAAAMVVACLSVAVACGQARAEERPNVVFILSDDQGPWALGAAGNPEIRTPHLDRLAAEGIRFENFYASSPVCSPARATLLTGLMPSQHGVHDWIRGGNFADGSDPAFTYLEGFTTYTDILAEHGYVCGLFGKWHLGNSFQAQEGFAVWTPTPQGGGAFYGAEMIVDGERGKQEGYLTDVITDYALHFIKEQLDGARPFYASVHYTAPHSPWVDQHPEAIVESYDGTPFHSTPQLPPHPWWDDANMAFTRMMASPERKHIPVREHLKGYFAAVTAMDESVGRIVQLLEDRGAMENTLIIFMSDNGFNTGHRGLWGKGNATFPLNLYETSAKVPAIFAHRGVVLGGRVSEALLSQYDFFPTLLAYLGLPLPEEGWARPGRSFDRLLRGGDEGEGRGEVFAEYGPARMVRAGRWKYVHRYPYGPHELYDLAADAEEARNLLSEHAEWHSSPLYMERHEVQTRLHGRLEEWFGGYSVPEKSGLKEPVAGRGQLRPVGRASAGRLTFRQRSGEEYGR